MPPSKPRPIHDPFEDEINQDPAAHFLSPIQMYEYEDWADDSGDDEEVAWDAGITDFALFHDDRRQAQERQEQVPDRWERLLANQASALQRAVHRNRANSDPSRDQKWTPLLEDVPHLTPDNSPNLKDDFDIDSHCGGRTLRRRPAIPNYLQQRTTPPEELTDDSDMEDGELSDSEDEDELPVAFLVERARERRRQARKLERPGLRFNRTMSGKVHVWRRPSWHLNDVHEDVEAEKKAELETYDEQQRGRGRS